MTGLCTMMAMPYIYILRQTITITTIPITITGPTDGTGPHTTIGIIHITAIITGITTTTIGTLHTGMLTIHQTCHGVHRTIMEEFQPMEILQLPVV